MAMLCCGKPYENQVWVSLPLIKVLRDLLDTIFTGNILRLNYFIYGQKDIFHGIKLHGNESLNNVWCIWKHEAHIQYNEWNQCICMSK